MKTQERHAERRLYTRFNKRIPISIHYHAHCVARCFTSNICVGGALLDVDELGFTENALMEVVFGVNPWHAMYEVRMPAIVVWRNETQIAVSFEMLRKDTEELVQNHIDSILDYHHGDKNSLHESDYSSDRSQNIFLMYFR